MSLNAARSVALLECLLGIALAAMYWPGHGGPSELARWSTAAIGISAFLCFVRIRMTPAHWWLLALLSWAGLSLLWSTVFDDALNGFLQLVFMAAAFAIGAEISNAKHLYRGLGIGLAVSSVIAIAQMAGYQPVNVALGNAAPAGLFINSNFLGWAAALVFVLLLAQRDWLLGIAVLPALILSNCRIADLAVIACVGVLAWRWSPLKTIAGVIVLLGLFARPQMFDGGSLLQRSDLWLDTIGGFTFFGHGIGSFYSTFPLHSPRVFIEQTQINAWIEVAHAHNDFIEFSFELGIPGCILAAGLLATCWRSGRIVERLGLLCIGVTALAGFPLYEPLTATLFALMAGHAAGGWHRLCGVELRSRSLLYGRSQSTRSNAAGASREPVPA